MVDRQLFAAWGAWSAAQAAQLYVWQVAAPYVGAAHRVGLRSGRWVGLIPVAAVAQLALLVWPFVAAGSDLFYPHPGLPATLLTLVGAFLFATLLVTVVGWMSGAAVSMMEAPQTVMFTDLMNRAMLVAASAFTAVAYWLVVYNLDLGRVY